MSFETPTISKRSCPWLAHALASVAVCVLVLGCGTQIPPAQLVETTDPVTLNGKAVRAQPAAPLVLSAGDALEVGPKGMARLLYADGSRFMLMPEGAEPAALTVAGRSTETGRVVVKLLKGALAFLVPEKRPIKDRYELKALNTVTTIEGTAGRIITTAAQDRVALEHGEVTVTGANGATTKVKGLQEALFELAAGAFKLVAYDSTSPAERGYYDIDVSKKVHGY